MSALVRVVIRFFFKNKKFLAIDNEDLFDLMEGPNPAQILTQNIMHIESILDILVFNTLKIHDLFIQSPKTAF